MTTNPTSSGAENRKPVRIGMTRFADFCVSDPSSQFSKVLEIVKQQERDYRPSSDFWSRWVEGTTEIHRSDGAKTEVHELARTALHNRVDQYTSASAGYLKFWGTHEIQLVGEPTRKVWEADRLQVRVNPEWLLRIDDELTITKLHLKQSLKITQRLANPLLQLLSACFGTPGVKVMILDVHRGTAFYPTQSGRRMDNVLRMQAAAFLAGWDACRRDRAA